MKLAAWVRRIFFGIFFAAAFFLLIFTFLANLGGKSDTLKHSTQDFISEITGKSAHIGTLNQLNFFPLIVVDFEELVLHASPARIDKPITLGSFKTLSDFWDVSWRTGKFRALNFSNFRAPAGSLCKKELILDTGVITQTSDTDFVYTISGRIGDKELRIDIPTNAYGTDPDRKYQLNFELPVSVRIGKNNLEPLPITELWKKLETY